MYHVNLLKKRETCDNYLMDPWAVEEEWAPETRKGQDEARPAPVIGEQIPQVGAGTAKMIGKQV